MNHIELFAGCGGLSLGLETAGFELLLANELSPMASETFAYNHLGADLESEKGVDRVYWISSKYDRNEIKARLRENPSDASGLEEGHFSDLQDDALDTESLRRGLLVGSINDLNSLISVEDSNLLKLLRSGLGEGGVDLVSGGPPCQSFSLAGLRDHSNHRNQLPWEFARFVGKVAPKVALLENVSGILRAFKVGEKKYFAWFEVAKAFAKVGYVPLCLHVNAKYVGTAQNRPRFIMIALRYDVFAEINDNDCNEELSKHLKPSHELFEKVNHSKAPSLGNFPYYDVEKDKALFELPTFRPLISHLSDLTSVQDAIDDLRSPRVTESEYVERINRTFIRLHGLPSNKNGNHELRSNGPKVRARFRLYQILGKLSNKDAKSVTDYLKTEGETIVPDTVLSSIGKKWILDITGKRVAKPSRRQIYALLDQLYTKKQTQKALKANEPAPAALSIPDDACHYHESLDMQRTLTVREMARIQSFPDWYQIKSKVTTGGQMRKYEVPQYTQIGNAVPPLLGLALGQVCERLIELAPGCGLIGRLSVCVFYNCRSNYITGVR